MIKNFITVAAIVGTVSGCAVVPQVEYRLIQKPADAIGMTDTFYRQNSEISVTTTVTKKKSGEAPAEGLVEIKSKKIEYRIDKVGIKALTSFSSSTMVNIDKIENSSLVSEIGIEVADKVADSIKSYGAAFVSLIGLVALTTDPSPTDCADKLSSKGFVYDVTSEALELNGTPKGMPKKLAGGCITLDLGPLPVDAIPAQEMPQGMPTANYYYSACRDATVTVKVADKPVVKTVRVAEPRYVQFLQFPNKGKITMHSECGASVVTTAVAQDNRPALVNAVSDLVKNILDAAAKKGE